MRENGYRRLKCHRCGFEGKRDHIAILNIERRALSILHMGGIRDPLECPADERCIHE
ncbi:hypothetical protein [Fervidicoccus fontis]|uniref:hypothetical protein n=1 Tax=Fervidicoccus fontis TaxID=683846 RepID=UPI003CC6EB3B